MEQVAKREQMGSGEAQKVLSIFAGKVDFESGTYETAVQSL